MKFVDSKVILAGPVGVGKTTAITAISDITPVTTDAVASDMTLHRKGRTTVAMDYGMVSLEDGNRVHLYGTPGQERFSFMWDILSEGSTGLILLMDNTRSNPMRDLQFYLDAFKGLLKSVPLVVGVTRLNSHPAPSVNEYQNILTGMGIKVPVLEIDTRLKEDMRQLVTTLLLPQMPIGLNG